jgi:hypothetical protein
MTNQKLGIAYYNKNDWLKFINTVDDKKKVEKTWDEWKLQFDKFVIMLINNNINFIKVVINIDDMINFFKEKKLKNISKNRSYYVAKLISKK